MKATLLNLAFQMEMLNAVLTPITSFNVMRWLILCDAFLCLGVMPLQFSFFGMKTQRAASGKSADTSELVEPRSIIALLRCDALSRQHLLDGGGRGSEDQDEGLRGGAGQLPAPVARRRQHGGHLEQHHLQGPGVLRRQDGHERKPAGDAP